MKFKLLFSCILFLSNLAIAQDTKPSPIFKNNIKALPLSYFNSSDGNYNDYCFGIGYERLLNKAGTLAIGGSIVGGKNRNKNYQYEFENFKGIKFLPSFNYYPWGQKELTFGFGMALQYAYEQTHADPNYFPEGSKTIYTTQQLGIINKASIQYLAGKRINIGLEIGGGMILFSKYQKDYKSINTSAPIRYSNKFISDGFSYYNINFSIGYRF